jgi:hypothetical protein
MFARIFLLSLLLSLSSSVFAQEKFNLVKDLRDQWMQYSEGGYQPLNDFPITGLSTVYLNLDPALSGQWLRISSDNHYYIFINGKIQSEKQGTSALNIDSLLQLSYGRAAWVAIHQERINERDLKTEIVSNRPNLTQTEEEVAPRPYSYFRDFVVIAGLFIIVLFVIALRLNPRLAADYFSISRIFSSRDADDGQASARLTGGSNVQFYILCSMMIGFYLLIILHHLPSAYMLPSRLEASGFWTMWLQWFELSTIVFVVLLIKIFMIFSLTRLFGMRGMARFHFFNWIRLLLVVLGAATVLLFMYFISRGDRENLYVMFLALVVVTLIGWIVVAFFKLGGKSGHSMFHLFSYLCATEIIPLLITAKVLFQ